MAFKMKPGRGNYAKTGKGVPMSFKQDNQVPPNAFSTSVSLSDVGNKSKDLEKIKTDYKPKTKKYWTGSTFDYKTSIPKESVAKDVLSSQREEFKEGPSLINKDRQTYLYSPDPIKKSDMEQGMYRLPGRLANRLVAVGNNDQIGNRDVIYGPSGEGFEDDTQRTDPKRGFTVSKAAKAMSKLDKFFGGGNFGSSPFDQKKYK